MKHFWIYKMRKKYNLGFTLIELLIVVAVMAIIVAIALPNYREYVIKSNRAVAKGALLELASRQEQYFLNNRSYTDSLVDLGLSSNYYVDSEGQSLTSAGGSIYRITITEPDSNTDETTYTVSAIPQNGQGEDSKCATYTIDEQGQKNVTGSKGRSYCW